MWTSYPRGCRRSVFFWFMTLFCENEKRKLKYLYNHLHIFAEESSPHFNTFKEHFFAFMEDLTSFDFPEDPYLISDNEIQRSRNVRI